MDPGPLVKEQIEAGERFLAEFEKAIPVAAAFWLKGDDQESWKLYVTSERFTDEDRGVAEREVLRVVLAMRDPDLGPLDVRLIKPGHPLARAALDVHRLYPGKVVRLRDRVFGDMGIDEVYIYPSPVAVSSIT
jgi:hypothetical protein